MLGRGVGQSPPGYHPDTARYCTGSGGAAVAPWRTACCCASDDTSTGRCSEQPRRWIVNRGRPSSRKCSFKGRTCRGTGASELSIPVGSLESQEDPCRLRAALTLKPSSNEKPPAFLPFAYEIQSFQGVNAIVPWSKARGMGHLEDKAGP